MVAEQRARDYSADMRRVATLAQRDLREAWKSVDLNDPVAVKTVMAELLPALVQTYGPMAAVVAADFYDELRADSDIPTERYRARASTNVNVEQVAKSAEWAVQPLFDGDTVGALDRLDGSLQRHVEQVGRDTILDNAERDPSRPGWARMPVGETCRWCRMLASRGAAYTSRDKALYRADGAKYHDECDCQAVVVWNDDELPYDPAPLLDEYLANRAAGASLAPSTSPSKPGANGFESMTVEQIRKQLTITEGLPDSDWRTKQLDRLRERLRQLT
jgi:hypothetical protein